MSMSRTLTIIFAISTCPWFSSCKTESNASRSGSDESHITNATDSKDPEDQTAFSIKGGTSAGSNYPATGALITYYGLSNGKWGMEVCTATVICKQAVLTAAHCKVKVGQTMPGNTTVTTIYSTEFRTDPSIFWAYYRSQNNLSRPGLCQNGGNYSPQPFCSEVSDFAASPEYSGGVDRANDIAVARLKNPSPIATAQIPSLSCSVPANEGALLDTVGYGLDSAESGDDGTKQQGTMSFDSMDNAINFLPGPSGQITAAGDSGGPLYLDHNLIGVNSSTGTLGGSATSISKHSDWLSLITAALCSPSSPTPNGASAGAGSALDCNVNALLNPLTLTYNGAWYEGYLGVDLTGSVGAGVPISNCPAPSGKGSLLQEVGYKTSLDSGASKTSEKTVNSMPTTLNFNGQFGVRLNHMPSSTNPLTAYGSVKLKWNGTSYPLCYRETKVDTRIEDHQNTIRYLAVNVEGSKDGIVTDDFSFIKCELLNSTKVVGSPCNATYHSELGEAGDKVTLTATPKEGTVFDRWEGNFVLTDDAENDAMNPVLVLKMTENKAIVAHFKLANGSGSGGGGPTPTPTQTSTPTPTPTSTPTPNPSIPVPSSTTTPSPTPMPTSSPTSSSSSMPPMPSPTTSWSQMPSNTYSPTMPPTFSPTMPVLIPLPSNTGSGTPSPTPTYSGSMYPY